MTCNEFRDQFDVLYNNIMSNAAPGLNDYEKSVFLTKAQNEIVFNSFNSKGNKYGEGIDESAKRQIDFSFLISVGEAIRSNIGIIFNNSNVYTLPSDVLLIINEAILTNTGPKQVITLIPSEYTRLMSKSFREPLKNQVYKVITNSNNNITVEIIANSYEQIISYKVKYVRKPRPIILSNISQDYGGATIEGIGSISECELNPIVHPIILQRAVELAKVAYEGDTQSIIQLGQRSE